MCSEFARHDDPTGLPNTSRASNWTSRNLCGEKKICKTGTTRQINTLLISTIHPSVYSAFTRTRYINPFSAKPGSFCSARSSLIRRSFASRDDWLCRVFNTGLYTTILPSISLSLVVFLLYLPLRAQALPCVIFMLPKVGNTFLLRLTVKIAKSEIRNCKRRKEKSPLLIHR